MTGAPAAGAPAAPTAGAVPPIALEGLSKRFGAVTVADAIDLELAPGEALGIIGPNGAGKSTLFNLVAGNLRPDAGRVRLHGRDVTAEDATARCVAGVGRSFQIPRPFGALSVFENLVVAAAAGRALPERAVTDDCARILERTGLLRRANDDAGALSLLERKRLELARALATGPDVLLLDEIAGGLTEGECASLVDTIREIHAGGTALVWIEHVLHALTAVVSRIVVLDFGRVIASGAPADVMARDDVREIYLGMEV